MIHLPLSTLSTWKVEKVFRVPQLNTVATLTTHTLQLLHQPHGRSEIIPRLPITKIGKPPGDPGAAHTHTLPVLVSENVRRVGFRMRNPQTTPPYIIIGRQLAGGDPLTLNPHPHTGEASPPNLWHWPHITRPHTLYQPILPVPGKLKLFRYRTG